MRPGVQIAVTIVFLFVGASGCRGCISCSCCDTGFHEAVSTNTSHAAEIEERTDGGLTVENTNCTSVLTASGAAQNKKGEGSLRVNPVSSEDGDEERAGVGLLVSFAEKIKTVLMPSNVTPKDIARWLKKKKHPDLAFQRMGLLNAREGLFKNAQFKQWVGYVAELKKITGDEKINPISTLANKYGDNAVYKLIQQAKRNPETESLAKLLQVEQKRYWIDTKKNADESYHLFQLDKVQTTKELVRNPDFTAWIIYVDDLSTKHPELTVSKASTLKKFFADSDLLDLIWAARKMEDTRNIANSVEDDVLRFFLKSGKKPNQVLVDLRLDQFPSLDNPMWNTLIKYMKSRATNNPQEIPEFFKKLQTDYTNRPGLLLQILRAMKSHGMRQAAKELEKATVYQLIETWVSPQHAFKLLELDKAGDSVLSNPAFRRWIKISKMFDGVTPNHQDPWIKVVLANYGRHRTRSLIQKAKNNPKTAKIAKKLEKAWKRLPKKKVRFELPQ